MAKRNNDVLAINKKAPLNIKKKILPFVVKSFFVLQAQSVRPITAANVSAAAIKTINPY